MDFRRTEYWNDYSTSNLHNYGEYMRVRQNYLDTLTNCRSRTVLIFLQEDCGNSSQIFTKALSTRMRHARQTLTTSARSLP